MQDILFGLIEKFKKNSKLSMADKDIYEQELSKLIGQGDYNEDIEKILCEGPIESSMIVLAKYLAHVDTVIGNRFLKKFIYSKRIKENKGGTSGMRIIPLCAYYMDEKLVQDEITEKLFRNAVICSYKNDRTGMNKKAVDEIRKTLVPRILDEKKGISLEFVNKDDMWISIRNLFLEAMIQGEKANYADAEKVYKWLLLAGKDMGQYTEDFLMQKVLKNEAEINEKKATESERNLNNANENKKETELDKKANGNKDLQNIVGAIGTVVLAETKELARIRENQNELMRKVDLLSNKLVNAEIKEQQQSETIKELAAEKKDLQIENAEYIEKIEELEKDIKALQQEVSDQRQFTDTVSRNREKQSEEFLNKLASKLKVDYRDYCDAKNLEMSIDLGENMREQLGTVFSILAKNGINLG